MNRERSDMIGKYIDSPEYQILLYCLRGCKSEKELLDKFPGKSINWDLFIEIAKQEGVFFQVADNFNREITRDRSWKEKLQSPYFSYLSQGISFYEQSHQVLANLDSLGLNILLLKGPAIDSLIYREKFYRPRIDLDLVIPEKEFFCLEKELLRLGYVLWEEMGNYPIPEYINSRLYLKKDKTSIPLHLHRLPINNLFLLVDHTLKFDLEEIWPETRPFGIYRHIFCLSPELAVLFHCEHSLKHDYDQLVSLCEIAGLLQYYGASFKWDIFVSWTNKLSLERIAYHSLTLTKKILTSDIPVSVLQKLQPVDLSWGERFFIRRTEQRSRIKSLSFFVYLARYKGRTERLSFVFKVIFPPHFTVRGYLRRLLRGILFCSGDNH